MNDKKSIIKRLGDYLLGIPWIRDQYIYEVFRGNTYDIGLVCSFEDDFVKRLIRARKLGIRYCVIYSGVYFWDYPHPLSPYFISTEDIKITEGPLSEDDEETQAIEIANIYWFMQGKEPVKSKEEYYKRKREEELEAMKKEELKAMQEEQQKTQGPTMVK